MDINAIVAAMSPAIYENFKTAIALRKWPNGVALSASQLETCLQAVIAWESTHVPLELRTGFVPPKTTECADDSHIHTHEQPLQWKH